MIPDKSRRLRKTRPVRVRGIRGAITVPANTAEHILGATRELLGIMQERNGFQPEDVSFVIFSVTHDLDATFPAEAARLMGWKLVPMLCTREIPVPGSMPLCIRVLATVHTRRAPEEINHVYLGDAERLRPDLAAQ